MKTAKESNRQKDQTISAKSTDKSKSKGQEEHYIKPFETCPSSPHTAILLLKSNEPSVLWQTFDAITKYIRQYDRNIASLAKLGVIPLALPHVENPDIRIRRLALRFIAYMTVDSDVTSEVLTNESFMGKLANVLAKSEDVFVLEYCSLCMSRLTNNKKGCVQLVELNVLNVLFKRMKENPDPDVRMNCLQILYHLLTMTSFAITQNPFFNWPAILYLAQSKYIQLQDTALKITDNLLLRYDDQAVQTKFRDCSGLKELVKILNNYYFRDVHDKILNIFDHYVAVEINALNFYEAGCLPPIAEYVKLCSLENKANCLHVLKTLCSTWIGKQALYTTNMDLIFCQYVNHDNANIVTNAISGIENMSYMIVSAIRMFNSNIVPSLCELLSDETLPWYPTRISVLRVLCQLSYIIKEAAANLIVEDTFQSLRIIIRDYKTYPLEAQSLALDCFIHLLVFHIHEGNMKSQDFMKDILMIIMRLDTALNAKTCKLLVKLTHDDLGKLTFSFSKGEKIISDLLKTGNKRYQTALCQLMAASSSEHNAESYHALGTLEYMWLHKHFGYTNSSWDIAMRKLLDYHLASKFAFSGTLGITDITKDGFYVLRKLRSPFPTLRTILRQKAPYEQVAYYVCGFQKQIEDPYKQILRMLSDDNELKLYQELSQHGPIKKLSSYQLRVDTNLRNYLSKLLCWFGMKDKSIHYMEIGDSYDIKYREKCNEISPSIRHKAEILADFVIAQMSAMVLEDDKECSMANVDLHLADLMIDYKTPVLNLGLIRLGGQFERAVLYKVLADRVGIPCAITRSKWAHAWCEVAIPDSETTDDIESKYPVDQLRPNYVVDLYDNSDVRLHHKYSVEALKITGPLDAPKYTITSYD